MGSHLRLAPQQRRWKWLEVQESFKHGPVEPQRLHITIETVALAGLNDAELSVQNARSDHVAMGGPGLQAFAEGPSEEEMDEKIRQYTASSL